MLDERRHWGRLPEGMRAPVATVGFLTLLAISVGLVALGTATDRTATAVAADLDALTDDLVEQGTALLGPDADDLLDGALAARPRLRALRVSRGDEVLGEAGDWRAAPAGPVTSTAFARIDGEELVLDVVVTDTTPSVDWGLVALLWAVVVGGTLGIGVLFERGRRSRVHRLEETVRALSARDARVAVERQELLESKTGFVRAVSHELRTPLTIMRGIAQLLEARGAGMDDAQRAQLLGRLVANSDRLDALLQDLLDVDRLTSRTAHVARQDIEVAGVVQAVLGTLDTSQHVVEVDVQDVVAHATPGHVQRIVHHLVHNALKYSPEGGTVRITARRVAGRVDLAVSDDGPGVRKQDRLAVFEPLRRTKDDGPQPGLGLGLALVRRLAELHGGRAWVEDAPSGGAIFHVVLPDEGRSSDVDDWDLATHAAPA